MSCLAFPRVNMTWDLPARNPLPPEENRAEKKRNRHENWGSYFIFRSLFLKKLNKVRQYVPKKHAMEIVDSLRYAACINVKPKIIIHFIFQLRFISCWQWRSYKIAWCWDRCFSTRPSFHGPNPKDIWHWRTHQSNLGSHILCPSLWRLRRATCRHICTLEDPHYPLDKYQHLLHRGLRTALSRESCHSFWSSAL